MARFGKFSRTNSESPITVIFFYINLISRHRSVNEIACSRNVKFREKNATKNRDYAKGKKK